MNKRKLSLLLAAAMTVQTLAGTLPLSTYAAENNAAQTAEADTASAAQTQDASDNGISSQSESTQASVSEDQSASTNSAETGNSSVSTGSSAAEDSSASTDASASENSSAQADSSAAENSSASTDSAATADSSDSTAADNSTSENIVIENATTFSVANEAIGSFVERLYTIILERSPDEKGFYDWYAGLESQKMTGADLIYGFVFSTEFQEKNTSDEEFVTTLYRTILGREPDSAGKAAWLNVLNEGFSRLFITDEFIRSDEFLELCADAGIKSGSLTMTDLLDQNPKVTRFVNRLYEKVLSRSADDAGRRSWVKNLVNKTETAAVVVWGFIHSSEFTSKNLSNSDYVEVLYNTLLGRGSDAAGKQSWINALNNGQSRDRVLKGFVESNEFSQICTDYGVTCGTITLSSSDRVYQNPSQYYQISDTISSLSGGGYNLSSGYEGLKVAYVIKKLGVNGGKYTGMNTPAIYGPQTTAKVKSFQSSKGLSATGVVDLTTWKALGYSESDWYNLGSYVSPVQINSESTRSDCIEAMISRAYDYLGTSYVVGASGAPGTGVDCSGLVMQALYAAGMDLSPINPIRHSKPGYEYESANMWASSKFKHVSYSERQRGDLIFYQNSSGTVIHVAIYLGNNQVIESWCEPVNRVVVWPITNSYRSNIKGVVRPFV